MQDLGGWMHLQGPKGYDVWLLPTICRCVPHLQRHAICKAESNSHLWPHFMIAEAAG